MTNRSSRLLIWTPPIAVFLISLTAYLLTLPRSITLEDAGLFQLVCHLGGISHPPGYPLFTSICQPFVQLPLMEALPGKGVFAGNLLNAIFAALATGLLHHIAFRLESRRFAWVISLGYALSATFWSQAIIIEVYSLSSLLFLISLAMTLKFIETADMRYWYGLGFSFGLGLSNHWPLMLLSAPALMLLLTASYQQLTAEMARLKFWVFSVFSLLLGLTPYITLVTDPEPVIGVFGGIKTAEQFIKYLTRAAYTDNLGPADIYDKIKYIGWLTIESLRQMGSWAAPLVIIGLWQSFKRYSLVISASILLLFIGSTYLLVLMLNFDYDPFFRSIFKPYPVVAYIAIAAWFALGIEYILSRLENLTNNASWLRFVPMILILLVLVSNFSRNDRSEDTFVERYATTLLNTLPKNSILFTYGDFGTAPFGYMKFIEGIRPDIEIMEWESLVFNNRLTSPYAPDAEKEAAILAFIKTTDRPVFSVANRLHPSINYGAYYQLNRNGTSESRIKPELDAYLQYLIYLDNNRLIIDAHEQVLLSSILVNFTRMYLDYSNRSPEHREEVSDRVRDLQTTFPGRLITMEFALASGSISAEMRERFLTFAREIETHPPPMTQMRNLAAFYEYYGRILALRDADRDLGITYLEKSIATFPTDDNPGIEYLSALLEEIDN